MFVVRHIYELALCHCDLQHPAPGWLPFFELPTLNLLSILNNSHPNTIMMMRVGKDERQK
jgi:hypothetical protein